MQRGSTTAKDAAEEKIRELIENYDTLVRNGKIPKFSEADVGSKFILPFLEALGWDVRNIDEVREQKRTLTGPVDYSLNVNRLPKLVVEIKRFDESLDGSRTIRGREESYPEQAVRYAWHLKVDWVVLSNFAETRLYYSHVRKPADGLIFKLKHNEYIGSFEKLWIISKESVVSGILDTYEKRRVRRDIDREVLGDLFRCRKYVVDSISKNNPELDTEEIKESVQKILDRILVIRVAEDRGIIGSDSLWKELDSWKTRGLPTPFMRSLKSLFRDFDDVYNSKLFGSHYCEDLKLDNQALEAVILTLYRYNFDLISADVLGAIYEDYLGHVLEETTSGGVQIFQSREARKKQGIYYTPTHLVEYVVRSALGELLNKCKSPEEVSRIKVLDPACGSGSFLIKAFDIIKEWYDSYNKEVSSRGHGLEAHFQTIVDVNRKILTENLFGVDIDAQAAEIASVNLMLKTLERGEKLPQILSQNIKTGNSLVDGTEKGFDGLSQEAKQGLKAFRWEEEFPGVFATGGFDVVIGNPPYYKVRKTNPIRISPSFDAVKTGPVNAAMVFIDRAINLAKPGGYVGLVLPKMLTYTKGWKGSRRKIFDTKIRSTIDCQEAFEGVLLEQVLLTLEKTSADESHTYRVGKAKGPSILISSALIPQNLANQEDFIFLEPSNIAFEIRQKMLSGTVPLGKICNIILGEGIQSYACWHETPQAGDLRILRGDDVQMWHIRGCLYFSLEAPELQRFERSLVKLRVPHIVMQRIVAHIRYPKPHIILMATFDTSGTFAFNTVVHILMTDPDYDYRYILGLLNSKLFSYYAYKFIYNNAVRSMDFYKGYAKRLPVKPPSVAATKEIIEVVESTIAHFRKPGRQAPEYRRYFTESVVGYKKFNDYFRCLDPSERDPRDIITHGVIKNLVVVEKGQWLSFRVSYLDLANHKMVTGYEVLKCRFQDRSIRTFLLNEINTRGPSSSGKRLLDKILMVKIPAFHRTRSQDEQLIRKQLKPYLRDYDAHKAWEKNYAVLDEKMNRKIYSIYGLSKEEVNHIEENSRPTGWHVN